MRPDALVVGAGPIGLTLGAELRRLGSVYLIRPDGYVGVRADWADRHALGEFLESYLVCP
jgi:NADPH-dependent 2,4-dienoyl-CoA reductase/sulfur reductase-like enzyme